MYNDRMAYLPSSYLFLLFLLVLGPLVPYKAFISTIYVYHPSFSFLADTLHVRRGYDSEIEFLHALFVL